MNHSQRSVVCMGEAVDPLRCAAILVPGTQPQRSRGLPWRGPGRWVLLASTCAILAACAGGAGRQARQAASPATPSSVEIGSTEIRLYPLPARLVTACEKAGRRVPILCPSTFPRRTVEPPSPLVSQQLDFGPGLYGVELGYSAPYEDAPERNRPDRFLHFVVLARTGTGTYSLEQAEILGPRRFGDRQGTLYYVPVESLHYEHYVFVWREREVEYQASLHSWDDEDAAIALLRALVSRLVPPDELPRPPSADVVFAALSERPDRLPTLRPGAQCPLSGAIELQGIPTEAALGPGTAVKKLDEGPIYLAFPAIPRNLDLFPPSSQGWRAATILVVSKPSYGGPVLLRGRRLDGEGDIAFGPSRVESELRLPSAPWDERMTSIVVWGRTVHPRPGWRLAIAQVHMQAGGCYGVQVDGDSFTYAIQFYATWQD
jgi:hypothetical protein